MVKRAQRRRKPVTMVEIKQVANEISVHQLRQVLFNEDWTDFINYLKGRLELMLIHYRQGTGICG